MTHRPIPNFRQVVRRCNAACLKRTLIAGAGCRVVKRLMSDLNTGRRSKWLPGDSAEKVSKHQVHLPAWTHAPSIMGYELRKTLDDAKPCGAKTDHHNGACVVGCKHQLGEKTSICTT